MPHIIQIELPILYTQNAQLPIHRVPSATDNIVYLIEYDIGLVAAVDGPDAQSVLSYCQKHDLKLTHILNTHTHGDHIGINRALEKQNLLSQISVIGAQNAPSPIPGLTHPVQDNEHFQLGQHNVTVWLTEGHINGHIVFVLDDFLFCGDTLFTGGCGYLFDGPPEKMHHSLSRLATLPKHTKVCCAHEYTLDNLWFAYSLEPQNRALIDRIRQTQAAYDRRDTVVPSTLGLELETNPFLRPHNLSLQQKLLEHFPNIDLNRPSDVFAAARQLKNQKHYRQIPLPKL